MSVRIALIVAMAKNRVIGLGGELPWHISEDLKFFKRTTLNKPVIMGRKTFQSIGRPLPGRENIVITRNQDYSPDGVRVVHDLASALALAKKIADASDIYEVMVIGGAEIYAAALPLADRIYLTEVDLAVEGDAFMPDFPGDDWAAVETSDDQLDEKSGLIFRWVVLDRQ